MTVRPLPDLPERRCPCGRLLPHAGQCRHRREQRRLAVAAGETVLTDLAAQGTGAARERIRARLRREAEPPYRRDPGCPRHWLIDGEGWLAIPPRQTVAVAGLPIAGLLAAAGDRTAVNELRARYGFPPLRTVPKRAIDWRGRS